MRIINVIKEKKSVAMCYSWVEQPMYIYHSHEELITHQQPNIQKGNFILINDFADYQRMINLLKLDLNYNPTKRYVDVVNFNIWIKTVDEFIPKSADVKGVITYELDNQGNRIPTDGVYVRLYYILPTPTRHVLFTSSGVHTIGITKWDLTGAVREWYTQESSKRNSEEKYEQYIEKLSNKRRPDVSYIKVAFSIFHPMSTSFMDIDESIKRVYGTKVKSEDREKLIKSKAFRQAMISAIKILFPELIQAIRKEIPPQEMAKKLAKIYQIAEDSGDVDKMLKVFQKIEDVGYSSQTDPIQNMFQLESGLKDPLAEKDEKKENLLAEIKDKENTPDSYVIKDVDEEILTSDVFVLNEDDVKKDESKS